MTYISNRPRVAMGDEWSDMVAKNRKTFALLFASDEMSCLNRANASSQVSAIDSKIMDLGRNWNPTGYFRPSDVRSIIDVFKVQAADAGAALAAAPLSTSDAEAMKSQAFKDVLRKFTDQSTLYEAAIAQAKASGANAIDAPGLKAWVISSMRSISDAYVTAAVLQCRQSWLESILDRAYQAIMSVFKVVAGIAGVVIKVGDAVIKAAEKTFDVAAFIIEYSPYAAIAAGGYLLYYLLSGKGK